MQSLSTIWLIPSPEVSFDLDSIPSTLFPGNYKFMIRSASRLSWRGTHRLHQGPVHSDSFFFPEDTLVGSVFFLSILDDRQKKSEKKDSGPIR